MGLFDNWFGGNSQAAAPYTNQGANWSPQGLNAPAAAAAAASAYQVPNYMRAGVPTANGLDWMSGYGANTLPEFESPALGGGPPAAGGGIGNWLKDGNNLGAVAQSFGALSSAWLGYQNLRNAKDQLNFQKESFNKNFRNQTQSYNTSLEDRIRGRSSDYAGKENDVQAYLDRHSLSGG